MQDIFNKLLARKDHLQKLITQTEKQLINIPEGNLRIVSNHSVSKKPRYYLRTNPANPTGTYIKEKDKDIIYKLAQKDYNQRLLESAHNELTAINKYLSHYPNINVEQVYEHLHQERQKLITPIQITNEEYIKNWLAYEYNQKEFDDNAPELYTEKNERVRSKSEVIIADALNRAGIPYRYECPLKLARGIIMHPDFTLLHVNRRKNIYWEHLGMMDDETYAESAINKLSLYLKNGISLGDNLILTFETKNIPLTHKMIDTMIKNHF